MNVYLKSAVQNLDCEIKRLQEVRAQLVDGADTGSVQTLELMLPNVPPAVPIGAPVAVKHRTPKGKQNGGGRKGKVEGRRQRAEVGGPSATPAEPVVKLPVGTERAKTLGGAMKLIVSTMGPFTREALRAALEKDYGGEEFVKDASASSFPANISYWLKSGKLEEHAAGVLKVVDEEFFGSVEFK